MARLRIVAPLGKDGPVSLPVGKPFNVAAVVEPEGEEEVGEITEVHWSSNQSYLVVEVEATTFGGLRVFGKVYVGDPGTGTDNNPATLGLWVSVVIDGCPRVLYASVSVNVSSGEQVCPKRDPCACESCCGGAAPTRHGDASTRVSPQGSVSSSSGGVPLRMKGGVLSASVVHHNADIQDVSTGNRAGRGSHLGLARHLEASWGPSPSEPPERVLVVGEDGRKAAYVRGSGYPPYKSGTARNTLDYYYQGDSTWVIEETTPEGLKYYYDCFQDAASGRLAWSEDPNGNFVDYHYDGSEQLVALGGAMGLVPYFSYDGAGRVASQVLRDLSGSGPDRAYYYEYDAYGQMTKVTGPECVREYTYDPAGRVTRQVDPEGNADYFTYDDAYGRLTKVVGPEGRYTYYAYDWYGCVTVQVNARGHATYYHYNTFNLNDRVVDALGHATNYQYDPYGSVVSEEDARGSASYYAYDGYNRVYARDALANESYYAYGAYARMTYERDALGRESYWAYDGYGNQTQAVDAAGGASYYAYDASGLRTAACDPRGNWSYYGYDAFGNRTVQKDPLGRATYYGYDAAGNQVSAKDARGNSTYYEYDLVNRQTKETDALGHSRETGYDGRGLKTVERSERGFYAYYTYDGLGQLKASKDFGGNERTFGYDLVGNQVSATDERGNTSYYGYDAVNRRTEAKDALGNVSTSEYDAVGNLVAAVDARGNASYFGYDALNRQARARDALGGETYYLFDAVGNVTDTFAKRDGSTWARSRSEYDPLNRVVRALDALEGETYYVYDAAGNLVAVRNARGYASYFAYDVLNRQTEAKDALGNTASQEYDAAGNVIVSVDALGRPTYFYYDPLNLQKGSVDALGGHTYFEFDAAGNVAASVDALGRGSYFTYDARNRQTQAKDALGNVSRTEYDAAGNVVASVDARDNATYFGYDALNRQKGVRDALGGEVYYLFDAAGNVTDTFIKLDASAWARSQTAYDELNRLASMTDPEGYATYYVYDAAGSVVCLVDPLQQASYFAYDLLGRTLSAKNPLGETASFGYDGNGNQTALAAPGGEVSYYGYDALDRLAFVQADAFGTDAGTYYAYDTMGNRTEFKDAEGHSTYFGYDALGRLASERDALGKSEYYAYDAVGNLVCRKDGDAQETYYAHDAVNRLVRADFPEGVSAYDAYDAAGNLVRHETPETTPAYGWGTQPWGTSPWGGQAGGTESCMEYFAYDERNRPVRRTIAGLGTLYFAYDLAGRRTMVKDWTGSAVYYRYDGRGLVTRVDACVPCPYFDYPMPTYYAFDVRGAMLSKRLPNSAITHHAYDDAGRLASLRNLKSDGSAISTFEFTRDPNGNITKSLREDGSCWYDQHHDGLQALTGADWKASDGSSIYAYEYAYDKVGNRSHIVENGTPTYYAYNAANELLHEVTPGGEIAYYTYDGRGNQTQRKALGGHTHYFEYNSRNLITRIDSTGSGFAPNTFAYNALGQRIRKTDSKETTHYVWDGLNITHEHDGAGNVTRLYTHGHSPIPGAFSLIDVEDVVAALHYIYHLGPVGEVNRLTSAAQAIAKAYEVSPYGRILAETGAAPNDFVSPATYLGLHDLKRIGLSPARLYDARLGRYTSRDPLWGRQPASPGSGNLQPARQGSVPFTGASLRSPGRRSALTRGSEDVQYSSSYAFAGCSPGVWIDSSGLDRYVIRHGVHPSLVVPERDHQGRIVTWWKYDMKAYWPEEWGIFEIIFTPVNLAACIIAGHATVVRARWDEPHDALFRISSTCEEDRELLRRLEDQRSRREVVLVQLAGMQLLALDAYHGPPTTRAHRDL